MRISTLLHRPRLAVAAVGTVALAAGSLALTTGIASGNTGTFSVVDYSQCANGKPAVTPPNDPTTCNQGWTNGILNANNSQYKESDDSPQRLIETINAQLNGSDTHTITLSYEARKNTTHAYDALGTWNVPVSGADRCLGLTAAVKSAIGCGTAPIPTPFTITPDTTVVYPFTSSTGKTSDHVPAGSLYMYGGTITGMSAPSHSNAAPTGCTSITSTCGDDYATTTITFTAPVGNTVELLFGGHMAVSTTTRAGWGDGLGASNINGGPYHIKWTAADGVSPGSRDNAIMGSSIAALKLSNIATSATSTVTIGSSIQDVAYLSNVTTSPTGTITFSLFSDSNCLVPVTDYGTNGVDTQGSTGTALGTVTVGGTTYPGATSASFTPTSAGTYYWIASYSGDANNAAATGTCGDTGESSTVNLATPGGSTTILLDDSVTMTAAAGHSTPTGSATFSLYKDDNTCSVALDQIYTATVNLTSGSASTTANTAAAAGHTYYWLVTYSGDGTYNTSTPSNCTENAVVS